MFWIGIGHAGTLISAILFLCRQKWRTAINRSSEATTLFAVICADIFPAIQASPLGKPTGIKMLKLHSEDHGLRLSFRVDTDVHRHVAQKPWAASSTLVATIDLH
jgi:hypothetical protein